MKALILFFMFFALLGNVVLADNDNDEEEEPEEFFVRYRYEAEATSYGSDYSRTRTLQSEWVEEDEPGEGASISFTFPSDLDEEGASDFEYDDSRSRTISTTIDSHERFTRTYTPDWDDPDDIGFEGNWDDKGDIMSLFKLILPQYFKINQGSC